MDAATIRSIRSRIAKLERMTVARGATAAEAANASAAIERLRGKLPETERNHAHAEDMHDDSTKTNSFWQQSGSAARFNWSDLFNAYWHVVGDAFEETRAHRQAQAAFDELEALKKQAEYDKRYRHPSEEDVANFIKSLRRKPSSRPNFDMFGRIIKPK